MNDTIFWKQNAAKIWEPTEYPSKIRQEDYDLPQGIRSTFQHLNSLIETKYSREYVKMCAFYNKLFPSLKAWDWSRSTHNSLPFSAQEQERQDSGTGITENFLKAAIDDKVSRMANVKFVPRIKSDVPNMLLEIYKEPVERYLKKVIKSNKIVPAITEVFHDAEILGFGHLFIDPWAGTIRKVSDWELGCYEAEFCQGELKRVLIRDFAFPVTSLAPYVRGMPEKDIADTINHKPQVDLKLFIDCVRGEAYATIEAKTLPPIEYPFESVLLVTYSCDIGVKRTMVTSDFDMGYPIQRAISKLNAKKTQLIEAYKGPVPVFNNDCDVIVKNMGNGAGEALFIAAGRNPAEVVTVINPTPLDPEMNAEKESLKGTMQELMGTQETSLDMENIRSAATVIAVDQLHDKEFQTELTMLSRVIADTLEMGLRFAATRPDEAMPVEDVPWADVVQLIDECEIEIEPVHNPTSDPPSEPVDYTQACVKKAVINIIKGDIKFEDIAYDYTVDPDQIRATMAQEIVKMRALGMSGEKFDNLERALLSAYIEDLKIGKAEI